MKRTTVKTAGAPAPLGPYSQGILVEGGRTLYIAGQVPVDPQIGHLVGDGDIQAQTERVLDNIGAILQETGMGFNDLVKVGIFLADFDDFGDVMKSTAAVLTTAPRRAPQCRLPDFPWGFY